VEPVDFSANAPGLLIPKLPDYLFEDDGLYTPEVGEWGEKKYALVGRYDRLFSTGMKVKWDVRVYIDLFSGAGKARIKGTDKIRPASPLLALSVPDGFNRYIFCDNDNRCLDALDTRVKKYYPSLDVTFLKETATSWLTKSQV